MILSFTLIPAGFIFLASLINAALLSHSWFMTDWQIQRYVFHVDKDFVPPVKAIIPPHITLGFCYTPGNKGFCPDTTVQYVMAPTEAAVASSVIGLMAGIVGLIAYLQLKKRHMDMDVNLARRRFWVGFVSFMGIAVIGAALAAFILHYMSVGPDEYQCKIEKHSSAFKIEHCTREAGACNLLPAWEKQHRELMADKTIKWDSELALSRSKIDVACNETRAVKYFQILLAISAVISIALINWQAFARKGTRYDRLTKGDVGRLYH